MLEFISCFIVTNSCSKGDFFLCIALSLPEYFPLAQLAFVSILEQVTWENATR